MSKLDEWEKNYLLSDGFNMDRKGLPALIACIKAADEWLKAEDSDLPYGAFPMKRYKEACEKAREAYRLARQRLEGE